MDARVFHISFSQVKFREIFPLKSAVKNAYCACLKGVLPEGAGVGVGQLPGTEVPVAATGHIRYVVDVEDRKTGSWAFVNNRPLTSSLAFQNPEPVFVNLLRSPGIDSQPGGPVRNTYLSHRPSRLHRLAASFPWNRFLGSVNFHKYGLRVPMDGNLTYRKINRFIRNLKNKVFTGG